MTRYKFIWENSVRISKTMFMLPEDIRPPYVELRIERDKEEILYLGFLEQKKNENCIKITKKKGKLIKERAYYYSKRLFDIKKEEGDYELIPTRLDDIKYYKVGKKIINGRK